MALESLFRLRRAVETELHRMGPDPLLDSLLVWLRDADADIARGLPAFADIAPAGSGDLAEHAPMTRTEVATLLDVTPDTVTRLSSASGPLERVGRRVTRESVRRYLKGARDG